jgi:PleD family two-component response regulator
MRILIVDDSKSSQALIQNRLKKSGFDDIVLASSAKESFELLGIGTPEVARCAIDLILMDNVMPEVDGVEATRRIKEIEALSDIPIIMVTASEKIETLQSAFDAGAIDFVKKPFNKIELLARVKSALKLKHEIDERKKAMRKLELLSSLDGLTGIANRRHFDDFLDREWRRSTRDGTPLSLILMDIDFFKKYNDGYGH